MTDTIPIPSNLNRLPRDRHGRIVPHFVSWIDGVPDFRIARPEAVAGGFKHDECWLCGRQLSAYKAFVLGPMCGVNRVTAEPPSHRDCARYAVRVCPFLTTPGMRRRPTDNVEGTTAPAGIMIRRNPGVALLWVTKTWTPFRDHRGGALIEIGDPVPSGVEWWREGRPATRAEVLASIESGMPLLREQCDSTGAHRLLDREYDRALTLVPA